MRHLAAITFFFVITSILGDGSLASSQALQRLDAIQRLVQSKNGSAIAFLNRCLQDRDARVRRAAAAAVGQLAIRDSATLRRLMVMAQTDRAHEVRKASADTLLALAPRSFAAKIGSANPPPVAQRPRPPLRPRARRAILLPLGVTFDARDPGERLAGQLGFGLRWGDLESQLDVAFPHASLSLGLRWLILRYPIMTPFVTGGAEVAFNNRHETRREAASLFAGGGLRVYFIPPIYLQVTVAFAYTLYEPLRLVKAPIGAEIRKRNWSIPVHLQLALELWP